MKKSILYFWGFASIVLIAANACNSTASKKSVDTSEQTTEIASTSEPATMYQEYCSSCHGTRVESWVNIKWQYGKKEEDIFKAIKNGYVDDGMPSFEATFSDTEITALSKYIYAAANSNNPYDYEKEKIGETVKTELLEVKLQKVAEGLSNPWGMTFLPNGELLVAELSGTLYRVKKDKTLEKINGIPNVWFKGQGGLMDIELHPKFSENKLVYLSYSKPSPQNPEKQSTTAVIRGILEGNNLTKIEELFEGKPYSSKKYHFGSRLEFDNDGHLFISMGDRGSRDENPQDLSVHAGKIHRIHEDGSIPKDNPFVNNENAIKSIWSYGHRNPQGIGINPTTNELWEHEHGPRGGDEVNIVKPGKNYGWPVISYGINYSGTTFTEITHKKGMEQPILYWVPSIAPCGMDFVKGNKYKGWEGDLLVGSLKFDYVNRCKIVDNKVVEEELILKNIGRVRNVKVSPDGYIYVATENPGTIYKLLPL